MKLSQAEMIFLDLGEIRTKKISGKEIETKKSFCFDCRPKKFKTGEIQTKSAKSKQ
jgi:hypothetical protein